MDLNQIREILRNPQALQAAFEEANRKAEQMRATGNSGGGMVTITLSGKGAMLECKIAPEAINASEQELLQDLVKAAYNDAKAKLAEMLQAEMPPGMGPSSLPTDLFKGFM